jgi:hypothetical protein
MTRTLETRAPKAPKQNFDFCDPHTGNPRAEGAKAKF